MIISEAEGEASVIEAPEHEEDAVQTRVSALDEQRRVLKHGETFGLFDRYGNINSSGQHGEAGLYHEGTRYLSYFELRLGGQGPLLLSSGVDEENVVLHVDLTNPDLGHEQQWDVPHGVLHLHRAKVLHEGACLERIQISNFGDAHIQVPLEVRFGADFVDLFEVRGAFRERRGKLEEGRIDAESVTLRYTGLDDVMRCTRISARPAPNELHKDAFYYQLDLHPKETLTYELNISCATGCLHTPHLTFEQARSRTREQVQELRAQAARIETGNEQFNGWLNRSYSDLWMMATRTEQGLYPYAGVPWFSTVFGRDGLITALQCMWLTPGIAKGVLRYLAHTQAEDVDPARDAEPGKILHEVRHGEMAALGEVPFARYYGSVDSTPLFVAVAAEYYHRTGDLDFIRDLWPSLERALDWMRNYGDVDNDGFIEYKRQGDSGLVQQGWKDSFDSVFHADGSDVRPPVALCEVQGYAYSAYKGASRMARALGLIKQSEGLAREAEDIRKKFEEAFWLEDLGTYALALDGDKKPCRVRTSNPGHCLMTGIVAPERAALVANQLLSDGLFSGWGIRTLHTDERRYNPIAYHNGSIWPHDNAMVAAGLSRYGFNHHVHKVLGAIFDISMFMDEQRLPELLCGFSRRPSQGPTRYPVACSPQVWASGAAFFLLQACLALRVDGVKREVVLRNPMLPPFLQHVYIYNLGVGDASVDLHLYSHPNDVGIHVVRKTGDVSVVSIK